MVNFNPAEIRGFHGRWMLGGATHPHLRHLLGKHRGRPGSSSSAVGRFTHEEVAAARQAVSARREAEKSLAHEIGGRSTPFGSWAASSDAGKAARTAGKAGGGGRLSPEEKAAREAAAAERASNAADRAAARQAREARAGERTAAGGRKRAAASRRRPLGRRRHRGAGWRGLGHGLMLARLGMLLHRRRSSAKTGPKMLPVRQVHVPAAKKAPAKKKPAAKKTAVAKQPRVLAAPKAPVGKTGKVVGKGSAQKVTPSAQVMANLSGYVNAPGGKRAGVGVAGRSSLSSTGRTAGSRIGGAGSSSPRRRH